MIGTFVRFSMGKGFDEALVRRIAEGARSTFEGMPGLRSKAFTFDPSKGEATNFYVWDSEEAARAFFNDAMRERVKALYGVAPVGRVRQDRDPDRKRDTLK
jgi:hypothetical protein